MSILLLVARLLLAVVFLVAGLAKIRDLRGSQKAVKDFGVPEFLAVPLGTLLPFAEIVVAIALIPTTWNLAWYGAIGSLALLLLFTVGISVNLSFGRKPDCNCFGQLRSEPIGLSTLVRNLILAAVATFVIYEGAASNNVGASAVAWITTLTAAQDVELVVAVFVVALLAIESWILLQTLTQVGKLQTRLELLEENGVGDGAADKLVLGLPEGEDAPDFALPDLDGNTVSLSDLLAKGEEEKKAVMLFFTSPTCGPCGAMLSEYADWQRLYHKDIIFAMISQGTAEANRAKIAGLDIGPVLLQQDTEVAKAYKARGTPSAVAIRFDGSIHGELAEGQDDIFDLVKNLTAPVDSYKPIPLLEVNRPQNGLAFPEPPRIGQPAPDLTLLDLDGNPLKLSDFRGSPTLLLFWSPSCSWCQAMLKDMLIWERKPPKGAPQLLVISTSGSKKENQRMGFKSTVVLDDAPSSYSAQRWFKAMGTPMAVLLDENGIVISKTAEGKDQVMELTKPVHNRPKAATV